jgi:hypothetical protein
VAIDTVATDENLTLELEHEHEVPPPTTPLKTHIISNPQLSLTQRSVQLVVLFERSG